MNAEKAMLYFKALKNDLSLSTTQMAVLCCFWKGEPKRAEHVASSLNIKEGCARAHISYLWSNSYLKRYGRGLYYPTQKGMEAIESAFPSTYSTS